MSGRCTGHCCEAFTLPADPEELWRLYRHEQLLKEQPGATRWQKITSMEVHEVPLRRIADIDLIAPMAVYLGHGQPSDFNGGCGSVNPGGVGKNHVYTCKHFDKATRNCTIYEYRPAMCRDYPYQRSCEYAHCAWEERKAKPELGWPPDAL